jgi:hypothetical protein
VKDRVGKAATQAPSASRGCGGYRASEVVYARRTKTYEMNKSAWCGKSYDAIDSCGALQPVSLPTIALSSTQLHTYERSFHLNGNDDAFESVSDSSNTSNVKMMLLVLWCLDDRRFDLVPSCDGSLETHVAKEWQCPVVSLSTIPYSVSNWKDIESKMIEDDSISHIILLSLFNIFTHRTNPFTCLAPKQLQLRLR